MRTPPRLVLRLDRVRRHRVGFHNAIR
jgi:hypothetical protein